MKLIIISGLSGSGKSIALNTLEDLGYYCIDNLPIGMLDAMAKQMIGNWGKNHDHIAVGIDARNNATELQHFPALLKQLGNDGIQCETFFLQAETNTLLKRFSETRRKHPLTENNVSLADAIALERRLLEPIAARADLFIDTTSTNIYQLRELVHARISPDTHEPMSLLIQSFGFKHGLPSDADFVFDVRCLPNPHWEPDLRPLSGRDEQVKEFLLHQPGTGEMLEDITGFLDTWIPRFENESRSYMTISIGCTGGQHRSVFVAEQLGKHFQQLRKNVLIRHREL